MTLSQGVVETHLTLAVFLAVNTPAGGSDGWGRALRAGIFRTQRLAKVRWFLTHPWCRV